MTYRLIAVLLLLCALDASARMRVYEAEGTFTMGDADTKQEAQIRARQRAKANALGEAGEYVEGIAMLSTGEGSGSVEGSYRQDITTITAGVVYIADEDVKYFSTFDQTTGNVTWICRLKARIDESDVGQRIDKIRNNRHLLEGLEEARRENARQSSELGKLRAENVKLLSLLSAADKRVSETAQEQQRKQVAQIERKRQAATKRLRAVGHFEKGLYAEISGKQEVANQHYREAVALDYAAPERYLKTIHAVGGFVPTFRVIGYEELFGIGFTFCGGERYLYGTFLQGGYAFLHPLGIESSVMETIQPSSDKVGLFFILPIGLFLPIIETDYAMLNVSTRAYLYNRVSHFEGYSGEDDDWTSFPPVFDVAIEWRSLLHSVRAGYLHQMGDYGAGVDWPSGLDLTGFYVSLHVGLAAVVPARR